MNSIAQKCLIALLGFLPLLSSAQSTDEGLISSFAAKRLSLVEEGRIDIAAMSKAIRAAVNEGEQLERSNQSDKALQRLLELQSFAPLTEFPSVDVQMLASWLYKKSGDQTKFAAHSARVQALSELLLRRLGSGATPDDPVRIIMNNEIAEWTRMQLGSIVSVKVQAYKGRDLLVVNYVGSTNTGTPMTVYFATDPRVQARANAQESLFAPIPLPSMSPEHRALIELAKQKRERFLDDAQIPYLELIGQVKSSLKTAAQLDIDGKSDMALVELKRIEAIRPIEETPFTNLIGFYSFLSGRAGDNTKQNELRGLLFGINQVIAHSGDGLSAETAVHVIAVDEEYAWLNDKRLVRRGQKLLETKAGVFDVITAKASTGLERDYYFNITRMYQKYSQSLGAARTK